MPGSRLAAGGVALRRIGALVLTAALAGVLVAGLVLPVAGLTGFTARQVADRIQELPESLTQSPIPQATKVFDQDGNRIALFYDENREDVPLDRVAPVMRKAIVAIEDSRFFDHGAIDIEGTARALINNWLGNETQGGSSITQQLIKLILVEQADTRAEIVAATEQSYGRKLRELQYAMAYERKHTKREILRDYLNIAFFGDGAYGIASASRHYFSVEPRNLTLPQAALLAGLVQNPTRFNPTEQPALAIARRNVVLNRMADLGIVSAQRARQTSREPLNLELTLFSNGCVSSVAPFFCDYVRRWLLENPALGANPAQREHRLRTGGLEIHTTLDQRFQRASDQAVRETVYATDQAIGGLAMVVPGTGEVRALSQSRPMGRNSKLGQTYLNYVVPKDYGDSNGFQGGSTFKLFVLSAAIEAGYPLTTRFAAPQTLVMPAGTYHDCEGNPTYSWTVDNSTGTGNFDMYGGTQQSVNTYFAQLEALTDVCAPATLAREMGVTVPEEDEVGPFTLGATNINPVTMASAYATVAARGIYCEPRPVVRVLGRDGAELDLEAPGCERLLEPSTADAVNDILAGVIAPGGFGAALELDQSAAGKTGTTTDSRAVWFAGYTPNLSAAAMIAGANQFGQPTTLVEQTIGGVYIPFEAASGSGFAGPMWFGAMDVVQQFLPDETFVPPALGEYGEAAATLPDFGGLSIDTASAQLRELGLAPIVGPTVDSGYTAGTVAYTEPGAGSTAYAGQTVVLYISDGSPYVPPTTTAPPPPPSPTPSPSPSPSPSTPPEPTVSIPTGDPGPGGGDDD